MTLNNNTSYNNEISIDTKMYNDLEKKLTNHTEQLKEVETLTNLLTNCMLEGEDISTSDTLNHFSLLNRLITNITADSQSLRDNYEKFLKLPVILK